jgi:hypothetical protein
VTSYQFTIFWGWTNANDYYDPKYSGQAKMLVLVFNAFNFFAYNGSVVGTCLQNLRFNLELPAKLSQENKKLAVEVILVGFFSGIMLMPGGNFQMQYYYQPFIPILLLMSGFPTIMIFFLFQYYYSCDFYLPLITNDFSKSTRVCWNNQHIFGLRLVCYLVVLKPYFVRRIVKYIWNLRVQ